MLFVLLQTDPTDDKRSKPTNEDDKLCTSILANLQRLFIHKKITPARLACLCLNFEVMAVRSDFSKTKFAFVEKYTHIS